MNWLCSNIEYLPIYFVLSNVYRMCVWNRVVLDKVQFKVYTYLHFLSTVYPMWKWRECNVLKFVCYKFEGVGVYCTVYCVLLQVSRIRIWVFCQSGIRRIHVNRESKSRHIEIKKDIFIKNDFLSNLIFILIFDAALQLPI